MSSKNYGPTVKYFDWLGTKSLSFKVIHAILCSILIIPGLELFILNATVLARVRWIVMTFGIFAEIPYAFAIMLSASIGVVWLLCTLGSIIEHKRYVHLRIESYKQLGLDYSLYGHWTNEESKLWLRGRYPNLKGVQMSQSEERRQSRKHVSIFKGVVLAGLGFFLIFSFLIIPIESRTDLLYITSLLLVCAIGILYCYWALNEFLSAYKDRDALMGVHIMSDFHLGHYRGIISTKDVRISSSCCRHFLKKQHSQNTIG